MSVLNGVRSDGQVGSIKSNLEEWREVVIKADAVLGWEEDWYPAITGGILTAAFTFIWYWDPTLLTFFAFRSYKVGFTFANVRSKEWRANSTVHAFLT